MANKSFREQEYLRRARELLAEQAKKNTPATTAGMTPQQKAAAAKNTAYENVLKAFIAQSNLQASDPVKNRAGDVLAYALQDQAQKNDVANVLISGEGTKPHKGDIKNWDAGTARNAIIENELFMELMRDSGMYDAPEYAKSTQYNTLASTEYLKRLLGEQYAEWDAVKQKNAQADEWKNKYENDPEFRATWQYWNELYNMQHKMTESNAPFFWAYADYLLGDRSQPFNAEALEQRWAEMPDEEFFPEMERLQKQYAEIDLGGIATANTPVYADDSGYVQATSNIETEIKRREQLDYFNKLASEIVAYEKENRGVDPTVYTSPFDYAYEDIDHGTVEGSRQLAAMMNDLGYYINNVEQLSYGQHGEIGTGNYWNLDFELSGYNFLTETEKNRYNALSSIGLGDAYLRALEADLLRRRAMWQENRDTVYAENPVTGVAGSVGTVITQPITATMTLAGGLAGEDNPNAPGYDLQRWQNTTRGVRGEIWGDMMSFDVLGQPVGTTIYNTLMSMADMGYAMMLSGGLAGGNEAFAKAGMQFIMSSEAAASTLHADLERGFSAEQALIHGIANGAVEAITEKLPIDTLFTKDGKFLWRVLKSGLSEGGEEVASGVLQLGTDALASYMAGKESEVEATYKEFAKTMSHEEAALETLKHYAQDIALQGLSGFGSGGMLGTVTHATNDAKVRGAGKNVQTQGDVDALITIAESMGENTQSRQWAERLKGKKKGNGKYSNYDVGRLTMALEQEVSAELAEAPNQVMDEAIEGRLLELGETPENAKALAPVVRQTYRGQPIKRSVARAVNWNDHAEQVVKELSRETTEQDAGRTGVDWANRAKDSQAATEQAAEKARRVKEAALGKGVPKAKMAPEAEGSVKKSAGKAAQKGEQLAELGKAVIKGDGKQSTAVSYATEEGNKQGEVVRFAEVDGSMQLVVEEETEGGKTERTVAPEDIGAAATKGLGAVIAYVTDASEQQHRMSEQEANTMLQVYNETGGDAQEFIEGYEAAYLAGYAGIEVPAVNIDSKAAELAYRYGAQNAQADEANRATRAGRRSAQGTGTVTWLGTVSSNAEVTGTGGDISAAMETMTESQRTTAEVVQALAKQMNIDVTLFESSADMMEGIQNGSFVPGTNRIYIDVNSGAANAQSLTEQKANGTLGYAMVKTMAHELTHYMESNSTEGYAAYKQAVKNALKESGQDWASLVRRKLDAAILAGNKLTLAGAEAEVIADASEYMLQNSAFVQGLDNSVRGKVKQFIQNFMEKVRSIFANLTGGHRESAALRQTIDGVMQYTGNLQRLWDAGIREATGRNYAENATMRTGTTVRAAADQNTSQAEEAVEEWTPAEESSEDLAEEWTPAEEADEEIWTHEEDVQSTDEQLAEEIYEEPAKAVAEERTVQEVIEEPTVRELKQEAKATQKIAPQELIRGIADRFGIEIRVVDRANLLASYNPDGGVILIGKNASTGEVLYKALGMELMRHAQNSQYARQLQTAVEQAAYAGNPDGYFADLQAVADEMNQRFDNYGKRKLTAESPIVQAELFARMAAKVFGNESSMMTLIEQNFQKPTLLQRIRNALKGYVNKLRGLKSPALTPIQRAEYLMGQALKDAQRAAADPRKGKQLLKNFTDAHVESVDRQTVVLRTTLIGDVDLEVDGDRKSATDNVGTFDQENADIRYSSRAEEYMDAATKGDTEKAQRLVDEAAEIALKDSKLRTPDGKLRKVYHGTNSTDFNVFDSDYIGAASGDDGFFGMGFYFAYTAGEASYYGRKRIISAYLDMKKPFNFMDEFYKYKGNRASSGYAPDAVSIMNFSDKFPDIAKKLTITVEYAGDDSTKRIPYAEFAKAYKDVIDNKKFDYQEITNEFGDKETLVTADVQYHEYEYKGETRRFKDYGFQKRFYGQPNKLDVAYEYLASRVFEYVDMPRFTRVILDNNRAFTQTLKNRGYDGTIQSEDGDEACVFESSQIKSAEPITYDDAGNIIPLGERFSRENPDIRYSTRTPEDTLSIREYLGEMKPTERMNETEKILLKRYQEQLKILREKEQLVAQQDEIIRTAPANSEELTKAKNRRNIYRAQANRAARAMAEAERNDGFARLMATSQEVVNRYLLGSAGNVADAADALDTEVADLTKKLKAVEADVTRTASAQRTAFARGLFDQQTLNKAAQKLKDTYGSRMAAKTIADRLALAYGEIYADDGAEGAKRFAEAVKELASDILAGHKYRYKSEVLPMLQEKIGTISLTETDLQEIRNAGITLSEYKRMLSPWVKVSEGASDLSSFASNAAYYGDGALAAILGEETEGNLAMNLYNTIQQEKAQEQEIGVEGMSEGQMMTAVMADIAGSDMPLSTNSKTVDYLRNELKKFAGESAEAAQNIEQAIMNARKATGKASDVWRAAVKEVETAKQAVEYYRKLEEQRRLTELKELKQTITEELKSKTAKQLQEKVKAQREEFRAREQKAREYRRTRDEVNKLRRSIGRSVKRLNGLRVRETDQKHVPEELQYMADLVMETFTESSLARLAFSGSKAASLSTTYANLLKLESDATHYWDDEIEQTMQNLSDLSARYTALATRQDRAPSYFSLEGVQLEQEILTGVQDIVDNVMQMIDSQNKQFVEGRNETFEQYAEEAGQKLKRHKDYKLKAGWAGDAKQAIDEFLFKGNVTPVYYFEHLQNDEFKGLFDRIRKGQSDYAKIVAQGQKVMREAKRRHNYSRWVGDKKLTLETAQGHTITLTREQALWAYATAKREQANKLYKTEHLEVGGFQYKSTRDIKGDKGNRAVDVQHQLKQSDIDRIGKWLTDEQKAYADELVQYLSTDIADYGNQASMEMYGYKKFKEKYYFPFRTKSDQRYLRGDEGPTGEDAGTGRIKNAGFTHKVQHKANQTLVMDDFSTVIADHVQKMAAYAAMVQPVEDLKRLLNYRTETEDGNQPTLRALLGQKYGMPAQNYMTQLLKDLNGATQCDERAMTIPSKLVNAFKRGAVAASLSVVLQQPTAMARAMAYINPKHFASNPFYRPSKGLWDEMMQYAGTAVIKDMGKFDIGMGLTASQYIADEEMSVFEAWRRLRNESLGKANKAVYDRFIEWLTAAPGAADQWTWGLIWKAVKHEQAELHPGMDTSSEEFLKLCGARFDDVIDHTQVYDSVLTRSDLMRSRNGFHKAATAFMSEPTLSLNMLYDALTGKHSGKQRAGIIGSVIASQVLAGAMAALVQAWNDDEDKRNWLEKYAGRATSNILDNLNPLGMIPYIGNIMDIISGYEVNRPDMEVVNDIIQYGKKYFKAFEDGGRPSRKETENFIGTLTNLLGIPYKNISREARRTWNAIFNTEWSAPDMKNVGYAVLENVSILGIINPWGSAKKDYYERMVTAMQKGDSELEEDYRTYLMTSKMVEEDKIAEGLRTAYKERYLEGGIDKQDAVAFLVQNGLATGDTEEARKKSAFKYVDRWEEGSDGYSEYASLKRAIGEGNVTQIDAEYDELINNGWSASQVYDAVDSNLDEAYISGAITKAQHKDLLTRRGREAGVEERSEDKWYWIYKELDYAKTHGGSTEGYDMHADLWTAVDSGANLRATINEYQSHGRTREDLNRAMNDHYQPILYDLYQTNRAEFTRVQARVLTAYAQLGYDREDKRKLIESWVK